MAYWVKQVASLVQKAYLSRGVIGKYYFEGQSLQHFLVSR